MTEITRRSFLTTSAATGLAVTNPSWPGGKLLAAPREHEDDISLAQWALVREIRRSEWTTLDFPRIAREVFDINGIEFVSTLFDLPKYSYLKKLRANANKYDVKMVLIMVDDEGETCSPNKQERIQAAVNHRKWIDIAKFLGCHAVRTNCRGPRDAPRREALEWPPTPMSGSWITLHLKKSRCIENHGGLSNDADWMVDLFKRVNHPMFGSYPDWREPSNDFDNFAYLRKMLPCAVGMSYRNQKTEQQTQRMIELCHDSGYHGWYGIESSGRDAIRQGQRLLKKYLKI